MTQSLTFFCLQNLLLRGHNVRYKVMEPFIQYRVSLEINKGQIKSLDASDVKLSAVKVMQKWMGVNGMLTAGEVTGPDPSVPPKLILYFIWHFL